METRLVRTSLPVPHAPWTGVADFSRAARMPAVSTPPPSPEPGPAAADWAAWPRAPAALPPRVSAFRAEAGSTATDSQSLPITLTPAGCGRDAGGSPVNPDDRCGVTVCTLAPLGGVKAKVEAGGAAKVIEVKPVWNAGLAAPRAKS